MISVTIALSSSVASFVQLSLTPIVSQTQLGKEDDRSRREASGIAGEVSSLVDTDLFLEVCCTSVPQVRAKFTRMASLAWLNHCACVLSSGLPTSSLSPIGSLSHLERLETHQDSTENINTLESDMLQHTYQRLVGIIFDAACLHPQMPLLAVCVAQRTHFLHSMHAAGIMTSC